MIRKGMILSFISENLYTAADTNKRSKILFLAEGGAGGDHGPDVCVFACVSVYACVRFYVCTLYLCMFVF